MLFSLSHGQHAYMPGNEVPNAPAPKLADPADPQSAVPVPVYAVVPDALVKQAAVAPALVAAGGPDEDLAPDGLHEAEPLAAGRFCYYFPDAPGLPEDPTMAAKLDALADSMVEEDGRAASGNSRIPPVFTYLGQFIDHDVTANTDRETGVSVIEGTALPLAREEVAQGIVNLRDGSLALDSLYGDTLGQHAFAAKLSGLMRFPGNRAKMRLGVPDSNSGRVPLPADPNDNATDLLRLGFLMRRGLVTKQELENLEPELRSVFLDEDGEVRKARAIIGDGRNDENLIVAQLHVLFLRLHNKFADATGSRSFEAARRLTRWHYQWLVVNEYLPTVCDPDVVAEIVNLGAPRYTAFLDEHGAVGPKMPMPLEFSVAAFRFGHSMVRGAYDHNRFFGEPVPGTESVIAPVAAFSFLFGFTGNGKMLGQPDLGQLPRNWVIEWERWLRTDSTRPVRAARKIDTHLALPLNDMVNESPDANSMFRRLARRNLRRGYRLNLPTAQGCIEAINQAGYRPFPVLTPDRLLSGSETRRAAVEAGDFDKATPLWFYLLKEAEEAGGEHLGPLGSHLVAETLVGLVVNDPDSYWNAPGGRWSPDKFRANDPIDSLEDVARFCGML